LYLVLSRSQAISNYFAQDTLAKKMGSSQFPIAKIESGDPSVSLDLIFRALLTSGVTRQELAQVIIGS